MSEKEKIEDFLTEEELKDVRQLIKDLNTAKLKLADGIMEQENVKKVLGIIKEKLIEQERVLITKYGQDSSINLETGKITQKQAEAFLKK
jgi:nitrogen regulatory protein PII-like uncharacterized protein